MSLRGMLNALAHVSAAVAILAPAASAADPAPSSTPPKAPTYHYVALDSLPLPEGYLFLSTAVRVTNDRRIYGEIFKCGEESCTTAIYLLKDGKFTILHDGTPNSVAENGVIGGAIFIDYENDIRQAAIFRGTAMQLIPRLPGETTSEVISVSPVGSAVVRSTVRTDDGAETNSYYLYRPRQKNVPLPGGAKINALGMLAGNLPGSRGYRWTSPGFGTPTVLQPLSDDPQAQVWDLNLRGDVLGYSYRDGGRERIGFWRGTTFKTLFTEGTPEFPTVSNRLAWNELGQVVVSGGRNDFHPYLIPRAGVRLDLTTMVDSPLPTDNINFLNDINERGDILGSAVTGELYLLEAIRR